MRKSEWVRRRNTEGVYINETVVSQIRVVDNILYIIMCAFARLALQCPPATSRVRLLFTVHFRFVYIYKSCEVKLRKIRFLYPLLSLRIIYIIRQFGPSPSCKWIYVSTQWRARFVFINDVVAAISIISAIASPRAAASSPIVHDRVLPQFPKKHI